MFRPRKCRTRFSRGVARIGTGEVAVPRCCADRFDGAAKSSREKTETETIELERRSPVSRPGSARTGSSFTDRSLSAGDAYFSRRGGSLWISGRGPGIRMEITRASDGLTVFVRDLRQRHQGKHDAGGSDGRDRTDLSRDVREGRERDF